MGWKDFGYWIKGGVIGLVLFLIFYIIGFFVSGISFSTYLAVTFSPSEAFTIITYVILAVFIVIGMVIGWIYGKIKLRIKGK